MTVLPGTLGGTWLSPDTGFRFGLTAGAIDTLSSADAAAQLGAHHVRMEFEIGAPATDLDAAIGKYASKGIQVLPLAGFHGRMPSADEAHNLASWARRFGPGGTFWQGRSDGRYAITDIEFGNESSYSYQGTQGRGAEYAQRFRDAYDAIHGSDGNASVGLLAQADDGNSGSSAWVDSMFNAVPDLAKRVSGWTIHPYGPQSRWQARMDRLISQVGARGAPSSIPMVITEWGLATDDGRCLDDNYGWNTCMTYSAAADAISSTLSGMKARYGSRLRALYLYQSTDRSPPGATNGRESYFGALKRDQSDKGAYTTTVKRELASAS